MGHLNLKDIWLSLHFSDIWDNAMAIFFPIFLVIRTLISRQFKYNWPTHTHTKAVDSTSRCHLSHIGFAIYVLSRMLYAIPQIIKLWIVSQTNLILGPFSIWTTFQPKLHFPLLNSSKPISDVKLAKYAEVRNLFLNLTIKQSTMLTFNKSSWFINSYHIIVFW